MWRRLEFENFKSLRKVSLDLEQLTVLVGPNGSGKSSILQGAKLLSELTLAPPPGTDAKLRITSLFSPNGAWSPDRFQTRGGDPSDLMKLAAIVEPGARGAERDAFHIRVRADVSGNDSTPWVELGLQSNRGQLTRTQARDEQGLIIARELASLGHGPAIQLSLRARTLAQPSYLETESAQLRADGYGLPSMLAAMAATDRGRLDQLEADLSKVVPRARRLRTPPARVKRMETQIITVSGSDHAVDTPREHMGHRLEIDMDGAGWLDASLVSDGTLIVLGILTLFHAENCPKLILIDDLDHSVHPAAHAELLGSIRRLLAASSSLQVLCTTHAPYLLDRFEPREVRVLSVNELGHTAARKLQDHPDWSEALQGLSTGEFWSSVGESWVAASNEE